MTIRSELKKLAASLVPTRTVIVRNSRHERPSLSQSMDVDRIAGILRQAEGGDTRDMFALYRDIVYSHAHTQGEFAKRKLAVLGDQWVVQPWKDSDADGEEIASWLDDQIQELDGFTRTCAHLMDAALYPLSVVEKVYSPVEGTNGRRYRIATLEPVSYDLLDYTEGFLRIRDVDDKGMPGSTFHLPDPTRYIIHRGHLLTSPDTWGGPMRAIVFWWLFATMDREWWSRFLDRFGAPFLVGKYPQADDQSRWSLESAFSAATKLFGLVVSDDTKVEMVQANSQGSGDAFEKFHACANREISKLIVGQTLSAEGQNLGLGGGQGALQGSVRSDFRQWDAMTLGQTLRDQLFKPLIAINGLDIAAPVIAWGSVEIAEAEVNGAVISSLAQAGIEPTDAGLDILSTRLGFPLQRQNTGVGKLSALSAALLDSVPRQVKKAERSRDANDTLAANASRPLAQSFRGDLAPLRKIIALSSSAEDLEQRVAEWFPDWSPGKTEAVLEEALVAFSTNGLETVIPD